MTPCTCDEFLNKLRVKAGKKRKLDKIKEYNGTYVFTKMIY